MWHRPGRLSLWIGVTQLFARGVRGVFRVVRKSSKKKKEKNGKMSCKRNHACYLAFAAGAYYIDMSAVCAARNDL